MERPYYNAAIYCRLSQEDEKLEESLSIQHQKTLLTDFIQENGWHIADCYVDDGVSGTTFERGDFKRMIGDIEQGKINMVVTKDLSRLGRDYLKTGYYTEVYFPENAVRYIALNDGIDTLTQNDEIIPFRNILNEMYAKEISRKIKSSLAAKFDRGEYHGANAPLGYAKDQSTKKLVIDENSADTIRLIFSLSAQGMGYAKIRDILIEGKHLTRSAYLHSQNPRYYAEKYNNADEEALYAWSINMVSDVLQNEAYIGNMIHGREKPVSLKEKRRRLNQKDQWLRIENTHEPIIGLDVWETVQARFRHRERPARTNPESVLGKTVRCADCGKAMWLSSIQRSKVTGERLKAGTRYLRCTTHMKFGGTKCGRHNVNYNKLCKIVLSDIRRYAKLALESPASLIKALNQRGNAQKRASNRKAKRDYEKSLNRLAELERLIQRLFEENATGVLSDANYTALAGQYQLEQTELARKVEEMHVQMSSLEDIVSSSEKWMSLITKYANLDELNLNIVEELCEKILVHQAESIDGKRTQKIEIFYRFIGEAPAMEEWGRI